MVNCQPSVVNRKKVALYFGSFNPIHVGHLALANYLCEFGGIDELWFVVSPRNPFKQQADLLDDDFRLQLVRLAIADYPKFQACDVEFSLPRPSYTYHTLQKLKELYPNDEFSLLMGADNWPNLKFWYQGEQIIQEYSIIIYPRPGYEIDEASLPSNVRLVNAPQFDVSSTFIRESLAAGKDVRYFLPPSAWSAFYSE
ncbi:MAG: nicotinate-nucleotide adenylyltransferase [Bacteroidaceae bacterium]|nr:nicotinate-nucleotide adenylyltransferase [Bacteroidaceae bacterium]